MKEERFDEFAASIAGIHGSIQRLKARHAGELGLKVVHIFWLYLLRVHPQGLSAAELARAGRSTRSLVSREIGELTRMGLVYAQGDTGRRRYGWRFRLTEKGGETAGKIGAIALEVQEAVSEGIPEEDLLVFYRTLYALQRSFEALAEKSD